LNRVLGWVSSSAAQRCYYDNFNEVLHSNTYGLYRSKMLNMIIAKEG